MGTPAPIVIEMTASDAALPYAQVLVSACSSSVHDRGPCALGDVTGESARVVVIVSWEGTGHFAAKIEVGVRQGTRADWRTRRVSFDATDQEIERWRSVGLIIATLVGEAGSERNAEPQPSASSNPRRPSPPVPAPSVEGPPSTSAARRLAFRRSLRFLAGSKQPFRDAGRRPSGEPSSDARLAFHDGIAALRHAAAGDE